MRPALVEESRLTHAAEGVAPASEGSLKADTDGIVESCTEAGVEAALGVAATTDFAATGFTRLLCIFKRKTTTLPRRKSTLENSIVWNCSRCREECPVSVTSIGKAMKNE